MTREEARQIQREKDAAWHLEWKAKTGALLAEIEAKRTAKAAPVAAATKPRTFEVDGEQIPYEAEKCNDTTISNAWLAIAKANR